MSTPPRREEPDRQLRHRADHRTLVATAAVAIAVDVGLRSGPTSVGMAVAITVAVAALLLAGRPQNPQSRAAALAAGVFGAWCALRASDWLVPLDLLAAAGLLVLAAAHASGESVLDLHVPALLRRAGLALVQLFDGPGYVARALPRPTRGSSVVRGAALAVPLVLLLGTLLASADAVFASFFRLPFELGDLPGHLLLLALGAWGAAALLRLAVIPAPDDVSLGRRPLGRVEASVVLGAMVVLYSLFALAQLVALLGGADHVLDQEGLTRAEYARSGFFQLLAVSAITLVTLQGGRALLAHPPGRLPRRLLVLAVAAVGLTLVIVAVAIGRLDLYQQAFGLTMLRLTTTVVAVWLAVVFVLLGVQFAGVAPRRRWFVPASAASALLVLLACNTVNLEAVVVRRNVELAVATGRFDPLYLDELSDDAVPALVEALPRLAPADREAARSALCRRPDADLSGPWRFHVAHRAATDARAEVCRS